VTDTPAAPANAVSTNASPSRHPATRPISRAPATPATTTPTRRSPPPAAPSSAPALAAAPTDEDVPELSAPPTLPPPPPAASTEPAPRKTPPFRPSGFVVQAGVFENPRRAEALRDKLAAAGIPATLETRVQVGPFKSKAQAEAAKAKMKALGIDGLVLPPAGE
jgi:cell division protein FtsN